MVSFSHPRQESFLLIIAFVCYVKHSVVNGLIGLQCHFGICSVHFSDSF